MNCRFFSSGGNKEDIIQMLSAAMFKKHAKV